METVCPSCGARFMGPGAGDLAFNSGRAACATCGGTGIVRTVDEASLVPDESISIDDGAVLPWGSLMWGPHEAGLRCHGRAHQRAVL